MAAPLLSVAPCARYQDLVFFLFAVTGDPLIRADFLYGLTLVAIVPAAVGTKQIGAMIEVLSLLVSTNLSHLRLPML